MGNDHARVSATEQVRQAAAELAERERLRHATPPLALPQLTTQFRRLIDRVMGEAALYAPEAAALALRQSEGDAVEAILVLRGYRTTLPRRYHSAPLAIREMFVERRISSAFREIPGGQILGPTLDYSQRLVNARLARETAATVDEFLRGFSARLEEKPLRALRLFGKVTDLLAAEGLLKPATEDEDPRVQDVTREPLQFPAPRSARLQSLAMADTGALMALAYSAMRGQGGDHPTIGEVRVGRVRVRVEDARGRSRIIGQVRVTEAENISKIKVRKKDAVPYLSLGYGLCFGQNETKAICMGILDRSMRIGGDGAPAISQEFVLYHTAGPDAWGAIDALKLPAHIEAGSDLDLLRSAISRRAEKAAGLPRSSIPSHGA